MRSLYEINKDLQECYRELERLTSKPSDDLFEYRNGDVYSVRSGDTMGSESQIDSVRKRIVALKEEQRQRELWDRDAPSRREEAEKREKEMESYEQHKRAEQKQHEKNVEMRRLETFKQIKRAYKAAGKKHMLDRLINKLQGKSPNWKKIQEYSQEQLNYLSKVQRGDTKLQKARKNNPLQSKRTNWEDFVAKANNKYKIKQEMEYEESYHYGM